MHRFKIAFLLLLATVLLGPGFAAAQLAPAGFEPFKHVRWTADQGAPDGVGRIAQTRDGYLWLSTGDALYRFDGTSFERIDWPPGEHRKHATPAGLMVSSKGELWVGLDDNAGVAVYRGGRLVDLGMPHPPASITLLREAADGTVWMTSGRFGDSLWRFANGRWSKRDRPEGAVLGLQPMPDGSLWLALTHEDGKSGALARLAAGASRFEIMPDRLGGRPRLALDADHALWASDAAGSYKVADGQGRRPTHVERLPTGANIRSLNLLFDRMGGLWAATGSTGLFYTPDPANLPAKPKLYAFTAADGLTSDATYEPFLDREGSVWVPTDNGIDQFRRASAVQDPAIPADPVQGLGITRAPDGDVYITSGPTLFRVEPGAAPRRIAQLESADLALCPAKGGGIWVIQPDRALHLRGDRFDSSLRFPAEGTLSRCVEDRFGRLWVARFRKPLRWHDARGWHQAGDKLGDVDVWDMVPTPAGDVALTGRPKLGLIVGDRFTVIASPLLGSGTMFGAFGHDMFVSDSLGLARVRQGRVSRLSEARFPWLTWLRSMVQTERGETWFIRRNGIYRVKTADLDRAFEDPRATLDYTLFNAQDGLLSTAQHAGFTGTQSAVGGDGRIWFLNRQGAAWFDPQTLERNTLPPPVAIRSLASGGKNWRDPAGLVLAPGTRAIDISYAGLSLIVPERVRFRYRLSGVDDGWIDAGNRRTASYTNLGPGKYRFQVIAANNDGVWNDKGAVLEFEIRPTFVQSWPFKLLCGIGLMALLWVAWSIRLRTVAARIRMRMAERMEERERIARELHDTLLQSVQALTLRFQLAVDDLPAKEPARTALEDAIDRADRAIAEGRDRVRGLRSRQDSDIEQLICDLVAQQAFGPEVQVSIVATGAPRPLDPLALDEIARIAGEALFNIRKHAEASRIEIEIVQRANFHLRIADDGVGIPPEILETGKQGHFGLAGMRERAGKLRGDLAVARLPDGGCEVVLTVPGSVAYKTDQRSLLARFWSFDT